MGERGRRWCAYGVVALALLTTRCVCASHEAKLFSSDEVTRMVWREGPGGVSDRAADFAGRTVAWIGVVPTHGFTQRADRSIHGTVAYCRPPNDLDARIRDVGTLEPVDLKASEVIDGGETFETVLTSRPGLHMSVDLWAERFAGRKALWIGILSFDGRVPVVTVTFSPLDLKE